MRKMMFDWIRKTAEKEGVTPAELFEKVLKLGIISWRQSHEEQTIIIDDEDDNG